MFDVGYWEMLVIAIVAIVVVGPKELPNLLRSVGRWTGKARSMARHFRSGFDAMVREAEIEEMNKQWASHNQSIMASTPDLTDLPEPERDSDLEAVADLPPPAPAPAPAAPAPAGPKRARAKKPPVEASIVPPAP